MRFLSAAFLALAFSLPFSAHAASVDTAGLLSGGIWFSREPLVAGVLVRVHALVYNSGTTSISGKVAFYDGAPKLGEAAFGPLVPGTSQDVSVSWRPAAGYHKLYAVIESASVPGASGAVTVTVDDGKTLEREAFIEAVQGGESATGTIRRYVDENLELVREYGEKNLPAPVTESIDRAAGALEKARTAGKSLADRFGAELNGYIRERKDAPSEGASLLGGAKTPFAYAGAFLAEAASRLFDSRVLFYGGIFVLLLYAIRAGKRILFS